MTSIVAPNRLLWAEPNRNPLSTDGVNGDSWINWQTTVLFQKAENKWQARFKMRGGGGPAGQPGRNGVSLLHGTVAPDPLIGRVGEWYIWTTAPGGPRLYGPRGASSWPSDYAGLSPFLFKAGAPLVGEGVNGQYSLDTAAGVLYGPKTAGAWSATPAAIFTSIITGTGAPSNGLGVDGQIYIDTASGNLYAAKSGGVWGGFVSLVGPPGGIAGGTLTGALNWTTAVTVASAATTDIASAASNFVIITGTTTITGLGAIAQGASRWVRFSGALTLTHNGTSLILPGAANIVTAAGDTALFVSEGSGNWRCWSYQRAGAASPEALLTGIAAGNLVKLDGSARLPAVDGSQLTNVASGWSLLATLTASAVATLSDPSRFTSAYDLYALVFEEFVPVSDDQFRMRVTTDNGATYKSNSYTEQYAQGNFISLSANGNSGVSVNSVSNAAGMSGMVYGYKLSQASRKKIFGGYTHSHSGAIFASSLVGGFWTGGTDAVTGFQVYTATAVNFSGKIRVYGIKTT